MQCLPESGSPHSWPPRATTATIRATETQAAPPHPALPLPRRLPPGQPPPLLPPTGMHPCAPSPPAQVCDRTGAAAAAATVEEGMIHHQQLRLQPPHRLPPLQTPHLQRHRHHHQQQQCLQRALPGPEPAPPPPAPTPVTPRASRASGGSSTRTGLEAGQWSSPSWLGSRQEIRGRMQRRTRTLACSVLSPQPVLACSQAHNSPHNVSGSMHRLQVRPCMQRAMGGRFRRRAGERSKPG